MNKYTHQLSTALLALALLPALCGGHVAATRSGAALEDKLVVVLNVVEAFQDRRLEIPLDDEKVTQGIVFVQKPKTVRDCEYHISIAKWLPEVITLRVQIAVGYVRGKRYEGEKLVEVRRHKVSEQKFREGVSVKAFYE